VLGSFGFVVHSTAMADMTRFPQSAQNVLHAVGVPSSTCYQLPGDDTSYGGICRIGDRNAKPSFVLWGDSHADALEPLLDPLAKQYGLQGVVFAGGSCIPVTGVTQSPPVEDCAMHNAQALQFIRDHDIKNVFLAARWNYYVLGGPDHMRVAMIKDSDVVSTTPAQTSAVLERNLLPEVSSLATENRNVYLVKEIPEQFDFVSRDAFYRAARTGEEVTMQSVSLAAAKDYTALSSAIIDKAAVMPGVHVIDPFPILCNSSECPISEGSTILYRDEDHINADGAALLKPLFDPIFNKISGK